MKKLLSSLTAALLLSVFAAGCATVNERAQALPADGGQLNLSQMEEILGGNDPIEGFNRSMFSCNKFLMDWLVRPLGIVYTSILPRPVIEKIHNACINLEYPGRAISALLRAEWEGAGDETIRFLLNTTVGIAGLFDVAYDWFGFVPTDSNFGVAFAAWGIGPGCTLILPFSSAINVRDTVGMIFDTAFDLKTYIPYAGSATALNRMVLAHRSFSAVVEGSPDPYKSFRELALIGRELQVRDWRYRRIREMREAAADAGTAEHDLTPSEAVPLPSAPKPEGISGNWVDLAAAGWQDPVHDSLRVALFRPHADDDYWYMRLSLFNRDFAKKRHDRSLQLAPERPELEYSWWPAPEVPEGCSEPPARVVMLLPGIGGGRTGTTPTALAELFNNAGFSVVVLDSAFTGFFMAAAMPGRLPGFLPDDAAAIRTALRAVLDDLVADEKIPPEARVTVAGYSFGAMHTLKIAELENSDPLLNVSAFIAINPPVSLEHAIAVADRFGRAGTEWDGCERLEQLVELSGTAVMAMQIPDALPLLNAIDPESAEAAAGAYLRTPLRGVLLEARRSGRELPGIDAPFSWFNRNQFYLQVDEVSFADYAVKMLAADYPERSLEELYRDSSLFPLERTLREDPRIRVFHSYDDFLLTPEQRAWLDSALGERLTWSSGGGHLGNLFAEDFRLAIVAEALAAELDNL